MSSNTTYEMGCILHIFTCKTCKHQDSVLKWPRWSPVPKSHWTPSWGHKLNWSCAVLQVRIPLGQTNINMKTNGFPRNIIYTWWILIGFHRFSTSILVYRSSEISTNGDQQGRGWIVKHNCTPCKIVKLSKHHTQQAHFLRLPKENLSDSPFDVQRISMLLLKQRTKLRVDLSEGTVGSSTLKSPSWSSFAPSKLPGQNQTWHLLFIARCLLDLFDEVFLCMLPPIVLDQLCLARSCCKRWIWKTKKDHEAFHSFRQDHPSSSFECGMM